MMRVAALYDIHANLPALEAVLEEVSRAKADRIIVGGDVVPGPMPRQTLDCLRHIEIPVQFIQGNGEVAVLAEVRGQNSGVPAQHREAIRWNGQQLDAEDQRLLASWPKTIQRRISGLGEVLFCHATPRSENEIFTRLTTEERLSAILQGLSVNLVICGHTHMQFDRTVGKVRVLNAGSVGMPFGETGGYWLLLGDKVELRRTRYDLANAAERIRGSGYPQADEFAAGHVLRPRSEEEMLDVFGKAEGGS